MDYGLKSVAGQHGNELRRVGEALLENLDAVVERVLQKIRRQIPYYARFPIEEIRPANAASARLLITLALVEQRDPTDDERTVLTAFAEARARQGIPPEANLAGIQVALGEWWAEAFEVGRRLGASEAAFGQFVLRINEIATDFMSILLEAHRRVAEEAAWGDEHARAHFLRGLLVGGQTMPDLLRRATALNVPTNVRHHAFRARRLDAPEPAGKTSLRPKPVLLGVIDGDLAGIISSRPVAEDDGLIVGLGPAADFEGLVSSFRMASRALDVAASFGRTGVVDLDGLGLLAAVAAEDDVTEVFRRRYLVPIGTSPRLRDELVASIRALIEHGMDVRVAAESLRVHRNTLRYRLRRFEELTGADLSQTETLFEIWWTLQSEDLRRSRRVE